MSGAIFTIVGPSGAGKDTLMRAAAARLPDLCLVRRVITRAPDSGGEDFEAISESEFSTRLERGAFALHWQAHGLRYGIPVSVNAHVTEGKTVLFNGSRAMLREAARTFAGLRVIHVTASDAVLSQRLRARDRESAANIAARLTRARLPLPEGLDVTEIDNSGPLDMGLDRLISILTPDPETTT
ncbi:phosphonate metabolism protein/1,5-bisphosphokinase (PRPP-forming) PhnN [Aquicoccus sp.]|uniref:phosphonate metabolism protein/1,5-bisphosphokinase (PRPP-forming) PhnN n=1 Tax=Aquicoccus sp. TaxID=2055851 RepID=UPI003565A0D3